MGATRRVRRSMERKRINAARREYRRRAQVERQDAVMLDAMDFSPEPTFSQELAAGPPPEVVEDESPAVPDLAAAAFRRIVGAE